MKKLLLAMLAVAVGLSTASIGTAQNKKPGKKRPDREAIFKRLDKDKDGKVSKDEFTASRKTDEAKQKAGTQFARFDKDKDGFLTLEEFKNPPAGKKKPKKPE